MKDTRIKYVLCLFTRSFKASQHHNSTYFYLCTAWQVATAWVLSEDIVRNRPSVLCMRRVRNTRLSRLGNTHVPSDQETVCATMFVGQLYGHPSCTSLNRLRCDSINKQELAAKKLPPTDDIFMQYLLRVCLQLMTWRQACVGMQEMPNILQFGYQEKEGTFCPLMTTKAFAAPELPNDIVCDCAKDRCYTEACCFFVSDQLCTAACGCQACTDATHGRVCGNPLTYIHLDDD